MAMMRLGKMVMVIIMRWEVNGQLWLMEVFISETQTETCWEYLSWWVAGWTAILPGWCWSIIVPKHQVWLHHRSRHQLCLHSRWYMGALPHLPGICLVMWGTYIPHIVYNLGQVILHSLARTLALGVLLPISGICVKAWTSGGSSRAAWWLRRMPRSFRRR